MMLRYSSFFRNSSSKRVTLAFAVDIKNFRPLTGLGRVLQYSFNDGIGIDALGFPFEVQQYPVTQGAVGDGADIFARNVHAVLEQRADFSSDNQGLSAARA